MEGWKQCTKLPNKHDGGRIVVIDGKVYYGGGRARSDNLDYIVHCYDLSKDKWTSLQRLPVKFFGLGEMNGKLVAVGGRKKKMRSKFNEKDDKITNLVHVYNESSRRKWSSNSIPPMQTPRHSPAVLSLQSRSALVVAGGSSSDDSCTDAVEIFIDNPGGSIWYRTDSLPIACRKMFISSDDKTCYLIGGKMLSKANPSTALLCNQALCASVDDLLDNAVPAGQTNGIDGNNDHSTQSAWKTLFDTPIYGPAAAMLDGNLIAIGGKEMSELRSISKNEIYMYSRSTDTWVHISDVPASLCATAVGVMSSTEIVVVGRGGDSVYTKSLRLIQKLL